MSTKRGGKATVSLTRKQRQLRKEIEEIASVIGMDHWNIEEYEDPSEYRTEVLKGMKDQLVRSEIVMRYTLLDEFLTDIICDYYFRRKKGLIPYRTLWKTKPFKIFIHHLMDETYLLKKMTIVHAIRPIPSDVSSAIARINDVRNALTHSFFPEHRRRYMADQKVMYKGVHLFSVEGLERFGEDYNLADAYLVKRAFNIKQWRPSQG
jgi:hypothetical protein